jgi:hypothetical protein
LNREELHVFQAIAALFPNDQLTTLLGAKAAESELQQLAGCRSRLAGTILLKGRSEHCGG